MTSQYGTISELGEFWEKILFVRNFFDCIWVFQAITSREQ